LIDLKLKLNGFSFINFLENNLEMIFFCRIVFHKSMTNIKKLKAKGKHIDHNAVDERVKTIVEDFQLVRSLGLIVGLNYLELADDFSMFSYLICNFLLLI
jgi:hypothetical protein